METLLRIGLSNAVVALVMALVVVTVTCVWRRPAVLHALWLLVLVKLVTPPLIWVPVPWPIAASSPPVIVPSVDPAPVELLPEEDVVVVPDSDAARETPSVEISNNPVVSESALLPDALTQTDSLAIPKPQNIASLPIPIWIAALCGVWLAGALAWYALALVRLRRFRQMLRHAVPAPESLRQRTQRLAEKLRMRRCPGVWLVPGRVAPMLWAAGGRPRILFPAELLKQVNVEQQNALLVHELAHLRRRDHWVRWLEFAAGGLHWWNPVLWFARRELREAEEQCCDAWVTATLPGAGKTYATALLETLDFLSDAPPAMPLLASGVGRVVDLKRRLTMIMRGTTPRTLGWRGAAAVIGLGALLLPLLPAWVQAQSAPKSQTDVQKSEDVNRKDVEIFKYNAAYSSADLEKARAELMALEAVLEQRKAELAEAAARVEAARARVRRDEAATKAADGEGASKRRVIIATDEAANQIFVQTDGALNQLRIQELVKQLQGARAGSSAEVIVLDQATGKIIMKVAGDKAEVVGLGALLLPPPAGTRWVGPGDPGYHPGQPPLAIAASETDKRIINLEMKLKGLLSEVEKLRQERKPEPPKPADGESKPQSNGTTPQEKLSVVNQLYKAVVPAKAPEEATLMLQRLMADAERQKAQAAALAAERDARQKAQAASLAAELDASQARIKMLEDEIAKLKNAQGNKEPAKP